MNDLYKTKLFLVGSSVIKVLLVAGFILALGWGLVQIAQWKNRKPTLEVNVDGVFILSADDAEIRGAGTARLHQYAGKQCIGWWYDPAQWFSWEMNVEKSGSYQVTLEYALPKGRRTDFQIEMTGKTLSSTALGTGGWDAWSEMEVGVIELTKGEQQTLFVKPSKPAQKGIMNFVSLKLTPTES